MEQGKDSRIKVGRKKQTHGLKIFDGDAGEDEGDGRSKWQTEGGRGGRVNVGRSKGQRRHRPRIDTSLPRPGVDSDFDM